MAGDTRDTQRPAAPDSKTYATFTPPHNANLMPGGTANTAGGRLPDVGVVDVAKSIKLEEFKTIHQKPCVRDSLLMGILGGFGMGGIRAILGAGLPKASNWAVGTFCVSSVVVYEICQYKRQVEKDGIKRAVEIMDRKKVERKMKEEREKKLREKEAEDARIADEERRRRERSWWKVW